MWMHGDLGASRARGQSDSTSVPLEIAKSR